MKLIISPAKSLDFESNACEKKKTPKLDVGTLDSKSKDFAGEIMSFIFLAFIFRRF